ncbi:tyrosine-type recombinase/integrase [Sporolactobacillus spathodeae]|uniref:Site-specific recombinase XerD n=1 Tax=Sporolactobacillus spathodeae TaxID=1465502 RepID=A0ABS2Q7Z9_9BACL|nr:tyrosine-type recombinase/integrase [Sporolactobacillus spathodeae]MBM7657781.1 site-specific recombinase XerD [Sporolactobacillus spathodeae]
MWLKTAKKNSASTLNLRLSAIKSFLKYCSEENIELTSYYLDISSIHAFKTSKDSCIEFLSQEQLKLLFSIPDTSTRIERRNCFFMILMYETGGRLQEILDPTLNSIIRDESRVKIILHGKGNKTRSVPLLGQTVRHFDAYLKEFHKQRIRTDYLFYTVHDSTHTKMKQGTVDYFLKKYGSLAKERNEKFPSGLHAHMLKHSIAMAMYKKGIPISYIRDFLGHKSIDTTTVYSHADEEMLTKALESVNDVVNSLPAIKKHWKGNEQYLIALCGLD